MPKARYVIALGSNRPHARHGGPRGVISAALHELNRQNICLCVASPIIMTPPIGPSRRTFANAVALVKTNLPPFELLDCLKRIEQNFGRRTGQRWGTRTLDLDIILWSGGMWVDRQVIIPHPAFRKRAFVLDPMVQVVPRWRDPVTGLTTRHLHARLKKPKPVDRREKPD
ncbi:MAG: 2-amino-4-hydroxy-6-hydroxymethyldihydropteridine diphosphokinase [Alphaproteobacteria bacterium]|nr:2-amino-4-hydroxy-6-hydroxymethyldihydropteridine diphosphokinase [Alphaproteobacteria bacterium]